MYKSIPMRPFGKARPRVTRNGQHTFMPPQYEAEKATLKMLFGDVPDYENICLSVIATRAMPKSWSKSKKSEMVNEFCTTKPDMDNIIGAVMDALFTDDSNIVMFGKSWKRWGYDDEIWIGIIDAREA